MFTMKRLIKNLKEAKKIHLDWAEEGSTPFTEGKAEQLKIAKQKDVVIAALQGDKTKIRRAKLLLHIFIKSHKRWIEEVRKDRNLTKTVNGGVRWSKRWIKIYEEVLEKLNNK